MWCGVVIILSRTQSFQQKSKMKKAKVVYLLKYNKHRNKLYTILFEYPDRRFFLHVPLLCVIGNIYSIYLYIHDAHHCTPSFAKKATVDCLLGTKKRCTHCMVPTVHKITCHRESAMHGHHPWLWPCGPRDEQSGRALRNTTGYCSRRARSFAWRGQGRFRQFMGMKGLSPHQCHDHGQQTDELDQGIHTRRMPGLQH